MQPAIPCPGCGAGLLEQAGPLRPPARLFALIASIPARRASLERLLGEIAEQSRPPDGVILCLDGYGDAPAPAGPLPVTVYRTATRSGPGARWRLACEFAPDDILVCIDDDADLSEAPRFLAALATIVETTNAAAAAMGFTPDGHRAAPGDTSRGRLVLGCGCGLALRAGHLAGLQALAAEVRAAGLPDPLGPCGDDQALVSCHLWRRGVPLLHAATGPLSFAPGTQASSETRARQARGEEDLQAQALALARLTGWPFVPPVVGVEAQPVLSWEEELSAVPPGALRARGAQAPPGHRRVLVMDKKEPARSGVYDAPAEARP